MYDSVDYFMVCLVIENDLDVHHHQNVFSSSAKCCTLLFIVTFNALITNTKIHKIYLSAGEGQDCIIKLSEMVISDQKDRGVHMYS